MTFPTADDELSDRLMAFMNGLLGNGHVLEEIRPGTYYEHGNERGFQVATRMGCTFTIEIWGATRLEAARNYFDHALQVYERMAAWRPTISGYVLLKLGGGYWLTKEDRHRARVTLGRLKGWAMENLPVEPPRVR